MSQHRLAPSDPQNSLSCFPYGVGHSDEGVCLLVRMGPHRILLDCGLTNVEPLLSQPPADLVFCSHAHSDHAQGLLALHKAFPKLPIYTSQVTAQLLPLNWLDSPQEDHEFCQTWPWQSQIELGNGLSAKIFPSGHLPGAAAILLTYKSSERSYNVFYTGDFCLSNFQLVEGLAVEKLRGLAPDVLITEGSYGTARHPHRRQQEKQLMERIERAVSEQKNVLLPVPTLGLGQEILKLLRSHHQFTGRDIDIWVDGNIATACDIYLQLLTQFPASVQNFARHQPLFWDERVCPRMRRLTSHSATRNDSGSQLQQPSLHQPITVRMSDPNAESDSSIKSVLQSGQHPCIVLTDSTADLLTYCASKPGSWLVLLPEHPRKIFTANSEQLSALKRFSRISLDTYLLAEHSDGRNTTQLIHNLRPQHVVFVHGSPSYLTDLTSLEELQNRYQLHSPAVGTLVKLPLGDKFIQPAVPAPTFYEGELNETGSDITITLPNAVSTDPRWNAFADTGLIEARWQGEELVLREITQRELLTNTNEAKALAEECCGTCVYYRNQHCWSPLSHLHGLKVTPEGYCPVYEPRKLEQ